MAIDPMLVVAKDQAAAAWAAFWANLLAAIATIAAVISALSISISQARRESAKERRIAVAIAPALLGDLDVVMESLEIISQNAFAVKAARIAQHNEIMDVVRALARIRVPAMERFKDSLPTLGHQIAPIVIDSYATITRVVTLMEVELQREATTHELLQVVISITNDVGTVKTRVLAAQAALRPMSGVVH